MTCAAFPVKGSQSYDLLVALQKGPGTFYQVCERAGFDIENPSLEESLRCIFDRLISGYAYFDGKFYRLTAQARRLLGEIPAAPYVGQVAGPAYRGTIDPRTVYVTRRPERARA